MSMCRHWLRCSTGIRKSYNHHRAKLKDTNPACLTQNHTESRRIRLSDQLITKLQLKSNTLPLSYFTPSLFCFSIRISLLIPCRARTSLPVQEWEPRSLKHYLC